MGSLFGCFQGSECDGGVVEIERAIPFVILRLDQLANFDSTRPERFCQVPALLDEQEPRDGYVAIVQSAMQGIPATFGILNVYVDSRMIQKGLDKGDGIRRRGRGSAQQEGETTIVATIDLGLSEVTNGRLGAR